MKSILRTSALLVTLVPLSAFAGGSSGGTPPAIQLEALALSEKAVILSDFEIASIRPSLTRFSGSIGSTGSVRSTLMMESAPLPNGILLEVQPKDLETIITNAQAGGEFRYHEASAKATGVDPESGSVAMRLVEDPSVIIFIKHSEEN